MQLRWQNVCLVCTSSGLSPCHHMELGTVVQAVIPELLGLRQEDKKFKLSILCYIMSLRTSWAISKMDKEELGRRLSKQCWLHKHEDLRSHPQNPWGKVGMATSISLLSSRKWRRLFGALASYLVSSLLNFTLGKRPCVKKKKQSAIKEHICYQSPAFLCSQASTGTPCTLHVHAE